MDVKQTSKNECSTIKRKHYKSTYSILDWDGITPIQHSYYGVCYRNITNSYISKADRDKVFQEKKFISLSK